ncbi:hypothetical protein ZWY2020_029632 [Hordeum vulgare]|nr:hypothetical protein ZWY2020_020570 [Hordeum vulgare]KAI4988002.1 hypothetical protein ZWY2020_029632 [Hordeum vulgare]
MATAAATHSALRVGMKFNPTPRDAIGFYLRRRVLDQPLPDTAGVIHEARISRTVGAGGWIPNAKKVVQNDAGETIGFRETLRYSYKDKNRESDWLMEEYHICGLDQFAVVDGEERVLCKVYVLPGLKPGSVTLQQSEAGDSLLARSGVVGAHATMVAGQQQTPRPPQEPRQSQVIQRPAPPCPQEARKPAPPRALDKRRVAAAATMMTSRWPSGRRTPSPSRRAPTGSALLLLLSAALSAVSEATGFPVGAAASAPRERDDKPS